MVAISAAAGATVASSAAIQLSLVHPVIVGSSCMPSPSSAVDDVEKFKEQLQQLTLEEENVRKSRYKRPPGDRGGVVLVLFVSVTGQILIDPVVIF